MEGLYFKRLQMGWVVSAVCWWYWWVLLLYLVRRRGFILTIFIWDGLWVLSVFGMSGGCFCHCLDGEKLLEKPSYGIGAGCCLLVGLVGVASVIAWMASLYFKRLQMGWMVGAACWWD